MQNNVMSVEVTGHIRVTNQKTGAVLADQSNLEVDAMFELLIRGLIGEDRVARIHAVFSGGKPLTRGLRTLGSPVLNVPVETGGDLAPLKSQDQRGIRSIGTWTALLKPTGSVTYDTLGLVSSTGLLCAASALQSAITLENGDVIAVQWTISLRGN